MKQIVSQDEATKGSATANTVKPDFYISIHERDLSDGSMVYSVGIREIGGTALFLDAINERHAHDLHEAISAAIEKHTVNKLA